MRFITFFITLFFAFIANAAVSNAFFQDSDKSLLVFFDTDNETLLYKTSLRECKNIDKHTLTKVDIALLSKYIPSYIIILSDSAIKLYNTVTRKIMWIGDDIKKPIKTIEQDSTGEYIATNDGASVALYRFKKDSLEHLFTKEFEKNVVSAVPDTENNLLYIAERNGNITIWSFEGKLNKSINIALPLNKLLMDNRFSRLVGISNDGIYSINKNDLAVNRLMKGKSREVIIDERYNRLILHDERGLALYDYYNLTPIFKKMARFKTLVKTNNANFTATIFDNEISLFDIKKGTNVAVIAYSKKGALFSGGVNELMYNPINTILDNKPAEDVAVTCALVSSLVTGVYMPSERYVANISTPVATNIDTNISIDETSTPENITIDKVADIANPKVATPKFNGKVKEPNNTKSPNVVPNVNEVKQPTVKEVPLPQTTTDTTFPAWFANRKNLPAYTAVRSGADYLSSVKGAKKQIKDEVVRAILYEIVKSDIVKSITDEQVKKRFLWQTASKAAMSLDKDILVVDSFISPAKQTYIYVKLEPKLIKGKMEESLKNEDKLLNELSTKEYMEIKINVLE